MNASGIRRLLVLRPRPAGHLPTVGALLESHRHGGTGFGNSFVALLVRVRRGNHHVATVFRDVDVLWFTKGHDRIRDSILLVVGPEILYPVGTRGSTLPFIRWELVDDGRWSGTGG